MSLINGFDRVIQTQGQNFATAPVPFQLEKLAEGLTIKARTISNHQEPLIHVEAVKR